MLKVLRFAVSLGAMCTFNRVPHPTVGLPIAGTTIAGSINSVSALADLIDDPTELGKANAMLGAAAGAGNADFPCFVGRMTVRIEKTLLQLISIVGRSFK